MEIEHYFVSTDQKLVLLAIDGDSTAFEHLFNRYRNSIHQLYSHRIIGNGEEVSDLVQETFIKVYLKLDKYNPQYTFGQWVYTIARNTFVDYMRRKRDDLSINALQDGYKIINPPAESLNPEESFINSQLKVQFDHYLDKMTPSYRLLIELRFLKEYSYEEIAVELKLPLGTVKTRIHRAREQLCTMIGQSREIY